MNLNSQETNIESENMNLNSQEVKITSNNMKLDSQEVTMNSEVINLNSQVEVNGGLSVNGSRVITEDEYKPCKC